MPDQKLFLTLVVAYDPAVNVQLSDFPVDSRHAGAAACPRSRENGKAR
jgi:hypothetical protein